MRIRISHILAAVVFLPLLLQAQIYHITISDEIDLGLPPYIERVIHEAESNHATGILLEIDTFGGRVDAATQIKDLLLNTDLNTYAFVNKRAISAGALISLSCQKIGMAPGSSIGAATPVDGSGTKAPEKVNSYFRAEMGATAEFHGRNRQIAEGMVDEDIVVEGLSDEGKLITLTATDAMKWQMADYIAKTKEAFMDSLGVGDQELIISEINWAEEVVRFLTSSAISGILLSLGMIGLFFEIKSPGWGVPGTLGLLCLGLFFGSHYIINLASSLEIILFVTGVALVLIEVFVLPGFGVAGVAGILSIFAGIYLSFIGSIELTTSGDLLNAGYRLGMVVAATIAGIAILFRFLPKTSVWKSLTLGPEQKAEEGYVATTDFSRYVGRTGTTVTPLRPTGVGLFDNDRLDIVSEGGYIEQNRPVTVVHFEGYRLVVRENT